ncbi:hypothetical protein EMO92_01950 [Bifidobacterium reuteri]|uniref:Helicase ATP-binding domain-containing protein n=1 Tax=Bifidobacterium reuteri TaxID=983706 RepID=A0A5J5E9X0_9BIFI|nr:hypothetical protein EMO92_01950 [Bifidobacterium reuteri]TPF91902.1 hypothetical protein BW14_10840 [Bifidobacterium sp. UTBIF-68]
MLIAIIDCDETPGLCLKVLRSYQYIAANAISDRVRKCDWEQRPALPGRPGGYVWHTTGSGKTMTSFKSAQLIADSKNADKVVFLMDRIELGTQSLKEYRSFADNEDDVQGTENTGVLRHRLASADPKDTLIVTSIQKMSNIKLGEGGVTQAELDNMASKRIVFIVDECHRSTFGDMLQDIRRSFPNALYFGFTGFDSKWVNTLYLDKVIENESIIQAFSRTNRLFGPDKPFGMIRYYRKPHTMRDNIARAVKLYSGDRPLDLLVQKLPQNVDSMDARYREILSAFNDSGQSDLRQLPESVESKRKFAKEFVELNQFLEAAKVQGFDWNKESFEFTDENGDSVNVRPELDQRTYLILAQRYKELFGDKSEGDNAPGDGKDDDEAPYELDGYLTAIDTGLIDTDYMNANFTKWLKALREESAELTKVTTELHRSFATLSADEQRLAELFLRDVERGDVTVEDGMTLRGYITRYARREKDGQIDKLVGYFGVRRSLVEEFIGQFITEANINEFGRLDALYDSIDKKLSKSTLEVWMGVIIPQPKANRTVRNLLRRFVLGGGFDVDETLEKMRIAKGEEESDDTPRDVAQR